MLTKFEMEMQERHIALLERIARSLEKLNAEADSRRQMHGSPDGRKPGKED